MNDRVVFEDDPDNIVRNLAIVSGPPQGMLAWLVVNKVVKNAKQAESLLLWVAIGSLALAVIVFFWLAVPHQPIHLKAPSSAYPGSNNPVTQK